jgi:cytochrome c6
MKKLLILFLYSISLVACKNAPEQKPAPNIADKEIADHPGKAIYMQKCKICHGSNGNLGLSGAANLSVSALNSDEIVTVISNGRKSMAGFSDQLTPAQINTVAEYVQTLKK